MHLDQLLARNLGVSRRRIQGLIRAGRVREPSGAELGDARRPVRDDELPLHLRVDDRAVALHAAWHLLLHKPVGFVTALRDPVHRTARELVRDAPLAAELRPIGRLDLDTSGLLLWTTEGAWVQRLTHPKRAVPRSYHAALARPFHPAPPDLTLADGHRPRIADLRPIEPAEAHPGLLVPPGAALLAAITITGGAYHEVRRIFAALGSHVLGLCRVGFGGIELPRDLAPGAHRPVDPRAV